MILEDMNKKNFTEGDYVLWSTNKGLRVGKVRGIKENKDYYGRSVIKVSLEVINGAGTYGRTRSVEYTVNNFYKLNPTDI